MNAFKTRLFFSFFLISSLAFVSSFEKANKEQWFKGNLHTHSYWSDGDEFPEMIVDWYKTNGYDFLALSDHNILAEGVKWKLIPEGEVYQTAFEKYIKKYGPEWVVYEKNPGSIRVKLKTFEEYKPLFEEKGKFLLFPAEEITDNFQDKPIHLNASNVQKLIEPQGGESVAQVLQNNINAVLAQKNETGIPMMVHVNHPNFRYAVSLKDMIELEGERFFEIFNGHPAVNNPGDSMHLGTEKMWDLINISYLKKNQPLMYGIATDDSHEYHIFGKEYSNAGRGWVMVRADALNVESLMKSMENGQFYASTGVALADVRFRNNRLELAVKGEAGVNYEIQFIGAYADEKIPKVLQKKIGTEASFKIKEDLLFVRAKVISSKPAENPVQKEAVEIAWTQPVIYQKQ